MTYINGLSNCKWPGRNQIIQSQNPAITYYIDGAHTVESVQQFIDWFNSTVHNSNAKNVLLFNYTGDRNGLEFLKAILKQIKLDAVAFSKLEAYGDDNISAGK